MYIRINPLYSFNFIIMSWINSMCEYWLLWLNLTVVKALKQIWEESQRKQLNVAFFSADPFMASVPIGFSRKTLHCWWYTFKHFGTSNHHYPTPTKTLWEAQVSENRCFQYSQNSQLGTAQQAVSVQQTTGPSRVSVKALSHSLPWHHQDIGTDNNWW